MQLTSHWPPHPQRSNSTFNLLHTHRYDSRPTCDALPVHSPESGVFTARLGALRDGSLMTGTRTGNRAGAAHEIHRCLPPRERGEGRGERGGRGEERGGKGLQPALMRFRFIHSSALLRAASGPGPCPISASPCPKELLTWRQAEIDGTRTTTVRLSCIELFTRAKGDLSCWLRLGWLNQVRVYLNNSDTSILGLAFKYT